LRETRKTRGGYRLTARGFGHMAKENGGWHEKKWGLIWCQKTINWGGGGKKKKKNVVLLMQKLVKQGMVGGKGGW